jgi:hypothetical protein
MVVHYLGILVAPELREVTMALDLLEVRAYGRANWLAARTWTFVVVQ